MSIFLTPTDHPRQSRPLLWILGGVAVAIAITGFAVWRGVGRRPSRAANSTQTKVPAAVQGPNSQSPTPGAALGAV